MPRSKQKLRAALNKQKQWRTPGPPADVTASYYRSLNNYTRNVAAEFEKTVFPVIERIAVNIVTDSEPTTLEEAFAEFSRRVSRVSLATLERDIKAMVNGVETFQRSVFVSNVKKAIGVDVRKLIGKNQVESEMAKAIKANLDLIKTIDDSYIDRARKIINDGLTKGYDHYSVKNELLDLGGFKDKYTGTEQRRAKTIARDQTQKLMNSIDRVRQKDMGVIHYYWVASGDERTRDSHDNYNGKRFSWDKPPEGGHPGEEVNCRCSARPDTEELLSILEAA